MFGFMKKTFVALLKSTVNSSNHTKCISLKKWYLPNPNESLKGQITIHLQ